MSEHALRTPDADSRKPESRLVQRKCGCGGSCGSCSEEEKKKVQRRALGETSSAIPRSVESTLGAPGRPLDADTRATMESRFGRSFAEVRVHTDSHAAASAREIDAAAYTSGTHIVFGAGRFAPQTSSGGRLLAHELAHVVQQRSGTALPGGIGPSDDVHERAADRVADAVVAMGPTFAPPPVIVPVAERLVRRKREDDAPATESTEPARYLVEDSETSAAGQMRRGAFVEELDAAICATSSQEMARLGRSTAGCPMLEQWRPRIRAMGTKQLEVSLRRWAGAENKVRSARDYIPLVSERLAQSLRVWGATGQIVGVPPDLMELLGGGKIKVGVGSLLRGAIGGLFRKARDGAAAPANAAPVALAEGRPLDGGVASRMGAAFGRDFSDVRIHTDADAAETAARQNARAFTIGNEIAFGRGEYAPGTIVGDALLAHELAHVTQQQGAEGALTKSEEAHGPLEHDADDAAVHAVVSLWPGVARFARGMRTNAMPRLKSSLKLQRCNSVPAVAVDPKMVGGFKQVADVDEKGCSDRSSGPCCTPKMIAEIRALHPEAIARVSKAIQVLAGTDRGDYKELSDFDKPLQRHFGITSADTGPIDTIRSNYAEILNAMNGGQGATAVTFKCRDQYLDKCSEGFANTASCAGGKELADITFCASYDASVKDPRTPFLYERKATSPFAGEPFNEWVRTLIHEYAHVLCLRDIDKYVTGPQMRRGKTKEGGGPTEESYEFESTYPPKPATNNPDSYAWFAMEVSKVKS
jgi:hypothetical protein